MPQVGFGEWARQMHDIEVFDLAAHSLEDLEVRRGTERLSYFYDTARRTLIKRFLLARRPQVDLYVEVTLVTSGDRFTPRFRFWKKNTKTGKPVEVSESDPAAYLIKSSVDTADGHTNLMTLLKFIINLESIDSGPDVHRVVAQTDDELLDAMRLRDRADAVTIVQRVLDSTLTDREIALIDGRKGHVERFERLLHDSTFFEAERASLGKGPEALWQDFFESAPWIFGYGLSLVWHDSIADGKLERITTGANIWDGAGKRIDALMRSRAVISTLLFCEIKRHDTELLAATRYREPDVWVASRELVGGVAQLQKTVRKAIREFKRQVESHTEDDGTPTGLDFSTTRPRQVLVIGDLAEFKAEHGTNGEKVESFELFRRSSSDVEVVTFDELYERARFIVEG